MASLELNTTYIFESLVYVVIIIIKYDIKINDWQLDCFSSFHRAELLLLLPCKALGEEGQAAKNLSAFVELLYVGRSNHGDAVVVHDAQAVHTQAVTHWHKQSGEIVSIDLTGDFLWVSFIYFLRKRSSG